MKNIRLRNVNNIIIISQNDTDGHESSFCETTPKVVYYRDYKRFSNELFRNDTLQAQTLTETKENVQTNLVNIFNKHAPLKK